MRIKRKFGVIWKDLADPKKDPIQAVKVIIYMPLEIADLDRTVIEGIEYNIEQYLKGKVLDARQ